MASAHLSNVRRGGQAWWREIGGTGWRWSLLSSLATPLAFSQSGTQPWPQLRHPEMTAWCQEGPASLVYVFPCLLCSRACLGTYTRLRVAL